ncbi:unnamed protein product, partial [Ectocarpus sp. 12 AP-2014]
NSSIKVTLTTVSDGGDCFVTTLNQEAGEFFPVRFTASHVRGAEARGSLPHTASVPGGGGAWITNECTCDFRNLTDPSFMALFGLPRFCGCKTKYVTYESAHMDRAWGKLWRTFVFSQWVCGENYFRESFIFQS